MKNSTQPGITPPGPGQHKEEPEFRTEDDIPSDDRGSASDSRDVDPKPERGERDD